MFLSNPQLFQETQTSRSVHPLNQSRYTVRLALDERTQEDVYRVRYASYLDSGWIDPNPTRLFYDKYDALPNCQSIVIYDEGTPVASMRTCSLAYGSDARSPALDTFPEEIDSLLRPQSSIGLGRRGVEITRLVRSPAAANNQGLVFLLYRMAGYIGMTSHTQVFFACVRRNHAPFYSRFGHKPVTEPRPYPGLKCDMQLMYCTRERYDEIRRTYPVVDPFAGTTDSLDGFLAGEPVGLSLT